MTEGRRRKDKQMQEWTVNKQMALFVAGEEESRDLSDVTGKFAQGHHVSNSWMEQSVGCSGIHRWQLLGETQCNNAHVFCVGPPGWGVIIKLQVRQWVTKVHKTWWGCWSRTGSSEMLSSKKTQLQAAGEGSGSRSVVFLTRKDAKSGLSLGRSAASSVTRCSAGITRIIDIANKCKRCNTEHS